MTTDHLFRNSHITPEMRERLLDAGTIAAAYEQEGSIKRAAKSIGVGEKSFRNALDVHGISVRGHGGKRPHYTGNWSKRKTVKETPLDAYIEAAIYNGAWRPSFVNSMGISKAGCPYRGTVVCHSCPFEPAAVCDYRCRSAAGQIECEHKAECPCGWDQTAYLQERGLI